MTDTATPPSSPTIARRAPVRAAATVVGGMTAVVLGTSAAISPDIVGPGWLVTAGIMALLLAAGILGMRRALDRSRTTRLTLGASAAAMVLFALAHFYGLVDDETAVILFSIFMILTAGGLIVAGIAAIRARTGTALQRASLLLTGIWPIATIPAGAALGDVPHFLAIALWGVCWITFGASLLARPQLRPRQPERA